MARRWFKKRKLEGLDVDEVFFDSFQLSHNQLRWEHRLYAPIPPQPMKWLWVMVLFLFLFFGGRSFYLAVFKGKDFVAAARQNYIKEIWQRSPRGIIYSSDLTPLVNNISTFNLVAIPAELSKERESQEKIISFLGEAFNKERKEVIDLFSNINRFSFRPIPLFVDLSREELLMFQARSDELAGLRLEENFKRNYLDSSYFSHLLGYTGLVSPENLSHKSDYLLSDLIGKSGIEFAYEEDLRGFYGKTEIETSSLGKESRILNSSSASPGKNLVLFIDKDLQKRVTDIMARELASAGLKKGAVVAIDPRSGGVLALQSFPLYENNLFSSRLSQEEFEKLFKDSNQPLFNRAFAGRYPPGSAIKPFIGVAALEEEVIDELFTVNVTGSITVAGQEFRDWRAHGIVNLKKAIAVSSNVYFYTIGGGHGDTEGLGPYLIKDYLDKFGLNDITGIDIPGEIPGVIPDPAWKKEVHKENWFIGDTYNISIGQGDMLVTPLGLASAVSIISNNGIALKPRILKASAGQNLDDLEPTTPEILHKNVASPESIQIIKEAMREAVVSGTAIALNSVPVAVAGKTGTAQSRKGREPHSWFTAFAPYENPEIVLVVLVENGGESTSIAVPIARQILEYYFTR